MSDDRDRPGSAARTTALAGTPPTAAAAYPGSTSPRPPGEVTVDDPNAPAQLAERMRASQGSTSQPSQPGASGHPSPPSPPVSSPGLDSGAGPPSHVDTRIRIPLALAVMTGVVFFFAGSVTALLIDGRIFGAASSHASGAPSAHPTTRMHPAKKP